MEKYKHICGSAARCPAQNSLKTEILISLAGLSAVSRCQPSSGIALEKQPPQLSHTGPQEAHILPQGMGQSMF